MAKSDIFIFQFLYFSFHKRHNPKLYTLRNIAALLVLILSLSVCPFSTGSIKATPTASELNTIGRMPLQELFDLGRKYYETNPDSAIIYYTALSNRYDKSFDKKRSELCLQGTLERWEVVFFNYFDYSTAFDCLAKAKEICRAINRDEPRIALYYGCMYHTVYEQTNNLEAGNKAFDYFKNSFQQAVNTTDTLACRMSFGNLVEVAHSLNRLNEILPVVKLYNELSEKHKWPGREFDSCLYDALRFDAAGDYFNSTREYSRLVKIADRLGHPRYQYAALTGMISSLMKNGDYNSALQLIQRADTSFSTPGLRDGRMILHRMKAECYDSMGMTDRARKSMYDYVTLKDSLLSYNQASAIKTSEFIDELRNFECQLNEARVKRNRQMAALAGALFFILIIAVAWLKVRRKNRALEEANANLYRKNIELLQKEEEARQQRESEHTATTDAEGKYKGNTVTDDMRERLWDKIINIMDHSNEIYDPDFTLDRMAELCESKAKYISQIINEKGDNFKTLLNTYRIHTACRCLNNESNLTIEAIANKVGFRSANSFRSSFRRVTGLSPSDYIHLAHKALR